MTRIVWLASYPKSGNTWLRFLIGSLNGSSDGAVDINELPERTGIASGRDPFDNLLLIDSGLLTPEEVDNLRPRLYEEIARKEDEDAAESAPELAVRFIKAHDAYTHTASGEPLLGGARAARGAIVIVRDPRDVVPSLANHLKITTEQAVVFMNKRDATMSYSPKRQAPQLRQVLLDWSGHVASWLDQRDIPVHLVRYEDLKRATHATLADVLRFAAIDATPQQIDTAVRLASFDNLQSRERESGFTEWFDRSGKGRLFFRRGESGGWRDELTGEQVASIERAHGAMMARLGYELSSPP